MATPVTDLRLRNAGVSEEQADAIAGALEALSNPIRTLVIGQRVQMGLLLVVTAAILAPYISPLAELAR
jgi:ATP-dependent protease ClpP protease subunit